jgi:hypothetical protein
MTAEQAAAAASTLDEMFDDVHAFVVDPSDCMMLGTDEASARCVRDALRGHLVDPAVAGPLAEIFDEWLAEP